MPEKYLIHDSLLMKWYRLNKLPLSSPSYGYIYPFPAPALQLDHARAPADPAALFLSATAEQYWFPLPPRADYVQG